MLFLLLDPYIWIHSTAQCQGVVSTKVLDMLVETGEVKPSEIAKLKELYEKDGYKRAVEQRLLKFIHYNYNLLPMYAKPDLV
ncbi:hypothetical protein FGIG_08443 [Fasciola gigantica]|uniref:Uncharacterized protein n=1 Tax=Fasciola gigantica TaxID=46835 RepID=A0A504YE97_FASGI|nr:hypothetical protein FGIG_08443 [Fasciola gigantica]